MWPRPPAKNRAAWIGFVVGFFVTLFVWECLISLANPGHRWWAIWRVDLTDIIISAIGGLCVAGVTVLVLRRTRRP